MRAVVQRAKNAKVTVDGKIISEIEKGLVVFLGISEDDTLNDVNYMADKLVSLRIFEDEAGKMNKSALDIDADLLIVSQFTLLGDARKGRRPSFIKAAPPEEAKALYEAVVKACSQKGVTVKMGQFQAEMLVSVANDGPVTILLDSNKEF